ncbi:chaplin family protein, partial [Frigoribacterium sp. Leaf186]|uniref:chaplin family protein n=1 Tax=Frigoribacterium sp. Leaf186 TaxID=1736293 RepID=UPI0012F96929
MNKYVSRGLVGALFVGGIWALGTTAANAATTTGDDGLLSGTQVGAVVEAPVSAFGNAVSVLGDSSSTAAPAAAPAAVPAAAPAAPVAAAPVAAAPAAPVAPVTTTSGDSGLLSGSQGIVSVDVPVTVGGNAVSVLGDSASTGSAAPAPAPAAPAAPAPAPAPAATSGDDSVGSGSQAVVDVTLPVTVGGNAISVLGDSASTGSTTGAPAGGAANDATAGAGATSGDDGILGGTQVVPSVGLP